MLDRTDLKSVMTTGDNLCTIILRPSSACELSGFTQLSCSEVVYFSSVDRTHSGEDVSLLHS